MRGRAEINWITRAMIPAYVGMYYIFKPLITKVHNLSAVSADKSQPYYFLEKLMFQIDARLLYVSPTAGVLSQPCPKWPQHLKSQNV